MPALYASIIALFPRITAMSGPLWLMLMASHDSYPLNSEMASPSLTFTVYLSCTDMAALVARATKISPAKANFVVVIAPFMFSAPSCDEAKATGCASIETRPNSAVEVSEKLGARAQRSCRAHRGVARPADDWQNWSRSLGASSSHSPSI